MLRITLGRVYDPTNNIDGEVRDICVQNGKIVADLPPDAKRIDAQGMVIMPGGVDMHAHIAGPKVNLARKLMPDDHRADPHLSRINPWMRSGTRRRVPGLLPVVGMRGGAIPATCAWPQSCA